MGYYLTSDDREELKRLHKTMVCSVCGAMLEIRYDLAKHLPYLQCFYHPKEHDGIGKPNRVEDKSYEGGLRTMQQVEVQHGPDKARQLAKYQGVTSLTRPQAMEIMSTIWPEAPEVDKVAAAILCVSYGLNPLANHIFLIPFKDKETGALAWTRVWGIKAKRLVASRRGGYSYLDMTPRMMTAEEQIKVWGAVDEKNLCYITILKDTRTGAEANGFGKWPKDKWPKGTDKGNSQANMASIRSESQALDRLRPAEMPSGFVVADEQYIEGEGRVIDTTTGEITEEPGPGPTEPGDISFTDETTPPGVEPEPIPLSSILADVTTLRADHPDWKGKGVLAQLVKCGASADAKALSEAWGTLSPDGKQAFADAVKEAMKTLPAK